MVGPVDEIPAAAPNPYNSEMDMGTSVPTYQRVVCDISSTLDEIRSACQYLSGFEVDLVRYFPSSQHNAISCICIFY